MCDRYVNKIGIDDCLLFVFVVQFWINMLAWLSVLSRCHMAASYKLVTTFENDSCTRLTAVASTNLFYSCTTKSYCLIVFIDNVAAF